MCICEVITVKVDRVAICWHCQQFVVLTFKLSGMMIIREICYFGEIEQRITVSVLKQDPNTYVGEWCRELREAGRKHG